MTRAPIDIALTLAAKSDQLNADDLIGGSIVVEILDVRLSRDEQPVAVKIGGGYQPWKPCKTARRIMAAICGPDASAWIGRWVELYRDETVRWGGEPVGGIRVAAISGIDRPAMVLVAETRGRKKTWTVRPLRPPATTPARPTADLDALLTAGSLTHADVDRWLASVGKPSLAEGTDEGRAKLAGYLAADSARIAAIRALIPADGRPRDEE